MAKMRKLKTALLLMEQKLKEQLSTVSYLEVLKLVKIQ